MQCAVLRYVIRKEHVVRIEDHGGVTFKNPRATLQLLLVVLTCSSLLQTNDSVIRVDVNVFLSDVGWLVGACGWRKAAR